LAGRFLRDLKLLHKRTWSLKGLRISLGLKGQRNICHRASTHAELGSLQWREGLGEFTRPLWSKK